MSAFKYFFPTIAVAAMSLACAGTAWSQQVVKWAVATSNLSFAPALMAVVAPEVFAKHGVRLEISDLRGNSNNCMAVMLSGQADVCHVGITTGMDAVAEGANLKTVALTTGIIGEIVISTKAFRAANVALNAPVNYRIRALKGLRFVSSGPGTPNYVLMGSILREAGLSLQDVRYRTLVDTVAMIEGFRNDQIDGAMWSIGGLTPALLDKSAVSLINIARGDVPSLVGVPNPTAYAQTAWVEKNLDLITRTHAAMGEAIALLKSDTGKYSALIKAKYAPDLAPADWADVFRQSQPAWIDGARATKASWDYWLKLQVADSKRDYSRAAYEKMVMPFAQVK